MLNGRVRAASWLLASALLTATSEAQDATNRDQSQYTRLEPEGFPIREEITARPAGEVKLAASDLVIGVVAGDEARAYPVNLMWEPVNEVLNDTLGGMPITVTWCPVAHSAAVYQPVQGGPPLELGAVGLREGVFILYDRRTRSWWNQIQGKAISGPLSGARLIRHPATLTTWAAWRDAYPQTSVWIDPRLPGRRRFTEESLGRITLAGEGQIVNQDLVIGVEGRTSARAYLLRRLAVAGRVANDNLDGIPIVVVLGEDAVTVSVFGRRVDGRTLTLASAGQGLRDLETGSTWDARTGRAMQGPLAGRKLAGVIHTTALWYAWRSTRPDTTLWNP